MSAARLLARIDADLGCRVRVAGIGCEELGLLGAETLADSLDLDEVRAVVNIDGAGRFRDLTALTHVSTALGMLATRVVEDAGHPLTVEDAPHPYSDHWPFVRAGVPALPAPQRLPGLDRPVGAGLDAHPRRHAREGWGRPQKSPRARDVAALLVRELTRVDESEISRVDPTATRERLRESGAAPGMCAAGIWPEGW